MRKESEFTKKTRKAMWLFRSLDVACLLAPVVVYATVALFKQETLIAGRLALSASFVVVILLTILNAVAKLRLRSPVWILMLGLYVAVRDKMLPLIIILSVMSLLSDFFLHPMAKRFAVKLEASKTIDERMGENPREEI